MLAKFANDVGTQSLCSDFSQVRKAAGFVRVGNNFLNASHRVHSVNYNPFTTVERAEFLPPYLDDCHVTSLIIYTSAIQTDISDMVFFISIILFLILCSFQIGNSVYSLILS